MKLLLRIATITLVSGLIMSQFGIVHCQNKNNNPRKPFRWNFKDTDLDKIVEAVSEYTGQNFEYDPQLFKGKVTIIINAEIPPDLAYPVLEAVLASRGYALVPVVEDNLIKILPTPDAVASPLPTEVGKEPSEIPAYENLVTQIVPVEFAQASDLVGVLDSFRSAAGRVDAYAPANLLFITERASQVKRLVEIVKKIDVAGFEERWEIIKLKYQSADTLAQKITDVLSGEVAAVGTGQRAQPLPRSRTVGRPTERARGSAARRGPAIVGAVQTPLRIIPDEWSNSLIVVGVETMRAKVREMVARLDVESPFEGGNVHVYVVKNADCTEVATALESLMTTGRTRSRTSASGGTRQPQAGQPGAPGAVQAFAKEVSIAAYEPINALVITASPQDWGVLENVLSQIDVPESQVYVEVVIMQVTINNDVTVGVELAAIDEEDFATISTFGDLANFVTQGPLGFTGGLVGVVDGTMDVREPVTGQMVSVPKVPILITAIQTATDLDVLSAPALLTTDNKESKIHVGKNIPIVSGSARPLSQGAVGQLATVYNQVTRQDIGVTLTVTPQVSRAGEYVKLEIDVEVSDTIESEVGIDPNVTGPTLRKTEIQDTVIIQDGYMGIVGGLMSQGENRTRSQVPILGDIPLLGWFFRKTGRVAEKSNLVVIITPHIVASGEKLDELTARYRKDFDLQRLEMRKDMRYWRNVFKRVDMRKESRGATSTSRVSEEHADRVLGRKSDR